MNQSLQSNGPVAHSTTNVGLLANGGSPFYSLLEAAEQVASAPTVLEAKEGEVILLTLPPSTDCDEAAARELHSACLHDLVVAASIIAFAPLKGIICATGDYAYVVLRPRSSASPAAGETEVGCARID